MKQGAVEYIAKPFDHDKMIQAVKGVLEKFAGNAAKAPVATSTHAAARARIRPPEPSTFMYGDVRK